MQSRFFGRAVLVLLLVGLLVCSLSAIAESQGFQQAPFSGPDVLPQGAFPGGLDMAPSNPLGQPGSFGAPGGPGSFYVSDATLRGIMPLIPNLQFGYLYDFGSKTVNTGRFTADYLLPFSVSTNSEVFGEAHSEFDSFWNTLKSTFTNGSTTTYENGFNNRVDLSFGGGFRSFVRCNTLLGVNGFYDTSRLGETWHSSGGLGFEMAALVEGNDAIDLNFNWYGKLFNSNVIKNAFRYGPSNFDFQAGYSHELWNGGPDLRLSATGYTFDIGENVWGWNAGAELRTRDNMFCLKYAVGNDKVDRTYQTVGGFVNVGFQLENLFNGESPFTAPEPIFHSPRNLRYMLTQKVRRNWHQPTAVVATRQGPGGGIGPCANLDRFLASVAMSDVGSVWQSGFVAFPPVSHACLDPSKSITVEFDYTFGPIAPNNPLRWVVTVSDSTGSVTNEGRDTTAPGLSGHESITLNYSGPNQSAFTNAGADPSEISISYYYSDATNSLTISNVVIHFNQ
jgi:hypothetical protein